ncbi:MAG: hypothetical protein ABI885_08955 [Gammaproteobacteria bacterium]
MAYLDNLLSNASTDVTALLDARQDGDMSVKGSDSASLTEAQTKAREWADRALELSDAGELEQARVAEVHAEIWLTRMLKIEATLQGIPRLSERVQKPVARPPVQSALASRAATPKYCRTQLSTIPAMDQSTVANSVMLRAWKRLSF